MSLGLAAAATALFCTPVWPGYMSYDSLLAYDQGTWGVSTATWPPLHAYLFGLSHALGARAWGLFLAQTFVLFAAANLTISLFAPRAAWAALVALGFLASFVFVPSQMGVLFVQWRDVTTTGAALLGLALWLLAARQRQPALLALAALSFGAAVALRYNALPLVVFPLALMVWRPFLAPSPSRSSRRIALSAALAALALAWASTHWRLPDLALLPPGQTFAYTQAFDLIGVSACADEDDLPLALTGGAPMSGRQIRQNYDPRHLDLSLQPKPGVRPLSADRSLDLGRAWRSAIIRRPGCYLAHRTAVFVEQMGLARAAVFYPTHGGIDENPYGLRLAHPKASAWVTAYVLRNSAKLWRRPFLFYLAAAAAVVWASARRRPESLVCLALLGGALAYVIGVFFAGPAADARYIFPANTFCGLTIAIALAALARPRPAG